MAVTSSIYRDANGRDLVRRWCEHQVAGWAVDHDRRVMDGWGGDTHVVRAGGGPVTVVSVAGDRFSAAAGREVAGSATVEWLGDAFVVFRGSMHGDVGKATSEMVLVLGRSDAQDIYTALYHDERGVCRNFDMTFDGSHWSLSREDTDMFQRFVADVEPDRITGRWEASENRGSTWRKDFDLVFERV